MGRKTEERRMVRLWIQDWYELIGAEGRLKPCPYFLPLAVAITTAFLDENACIHLSKSWILYAKGDKEQTMSAEKFLTEFLTPEFLAASKPRRQVAMDDYHGTSVADPYRWLENL